MLPSVLAQWQTLLAGITSLILIITPAPPVPAQQASAPQAQNIGSGNSSRNWAGYAATNGSFTGVSGTWTIPSASATGHTAADATWVGIGGVKNSDLIQSGTQNIITPSGQVSSSAFYEMLPDASVTIASVSVKPGDSVSVSITQQASNQWQISFKDNANGQSYSTIVSYASSLSSAEWIEEAPSDGYRQLPLDNFTTVPFTNGTAIQNGSSVSISQSGAQAITMTNVAEQTLATPSAVGSDGGSFSVTRSSAATSSPIPQLDQNPRGWRRRGIGIGVYRVRWQYVPQTSVTPVVSPAPTASDYPFYHSRRNFRIQRFFFQRGFRRAF